MARLLLVDTVDALPGLLPLHTWAALMSSDLVLVGTEDHAFRPHLELAELRVEVVPAAQEGAALSRRDLLSGLAPTEKARAEWVVDRVRAEAGAVAYLFGAADAEVFTRTLGLEAARAGLEVEVVYFGVAPPGVALLELVEVQRRLRAPGGCPWDAEQTHDSLARFAVEEVGELLEAIASGDPDALREELGDVLLQVVFQAQIAADEGRFDIDAVARELSAKLIRRHPHVFGDAAAEDADAVVANWAEIKAGEGKPAQEGARADQVGALLRASVALARRNGVDPEAAWRAALASADQPAEGQPEHGAAK
jgi:XTP/dITP diphosphohydrolase